MVCQSRTRAARTSACPPAPWVQASVSRADVLHPLTDFLEHGYTVRLLVMKNKSQLEEVMEVILQLIVRALCGGLLKCLPGIGSENRISSLLHIRIKNYVQCHSLREFLTHAQLV